MIMHCRLPTHPEPDCLPDQGAGAVALAGYTERHRRLSGRISAVLPSQWSGSVHQHAQTAMCHRPSDEQSKLVTAFNIHTPGHGAAV